MMQNNKSSSASIVLYRIWDDARRTSVCPTRDATIPNNAAANGDGTWSANDATESTNDVTWSENDATRNVPC